MNEMKEDQHRKICPAYILSFSFSFSLSVMWKLNNIVLKIEKLLPEDGKGG
jgi:hypothetical protein